MTSLREINLKPFMQDMYKKLVANQEKKHWRTCSFDWLVQRLYEEMRELEEAMDKGAPYQEVMDECADVANFAMMIHDKANLKLKEKSKPMRRNL
jgi:NTP pyrophosphatase (non-canonical NTP hydrolase)